jgi:hypothetical protein
MKYPFAIADLPFYWRPGHGKRATDNDALHRLGMSVLTQSTWTERKLKTAEKIRKHPISYAEKDDKKCERANTHSWLVREKNQKGDIKT